MANKYQLSIVLLLVVLAASIKITPKSTDNTPSPPNSKDPVANSASKTTVQTDKKPTSQAKEDDSKQKNQQEAKTKEEQSKDNQDSSANTPSKSTSNSKNTAKKDTGNKPSSKKTTASSKKDDSKDQDDSNKKQSHNLAKGDEDDEENSAKQEEKDNKKGKKSKLSFGKKPAKSKTSNSDEKKEDHQRNGWGIFLVYLMIFAVLLFGLKYLYFKDSSAIQMGLDIALLIISFAKNIKDSRYGYKPPVYAEEIDDENTVNVGYGEQNGKQLFWEKNSVEGI